MDNRYDLNRLRSAAVRIVAHTDHHAETDDCGNAVEQRRVRWDVCIQVKGSKKRTVLVTTNTPEEAGFVRAAIEAFIAKMLTLPEKLKPPIRPRRIRP